MPHIVKTLAVAAAVACGLAAAGGASGQCNLANPSFEIAGSGGNTFGGWSQFGAVGSSSAAPHGKVAARVSGPNTGAWAVSAYWQSLDAAPGVAWSGSVCVVNPSSRPLSGQSKAIVNIEWRNSAGDLISYESHPVADAATPQDLVRVVTFTSGAAPAGTVSTHLLLGVLQGPTDPVPDVIYDQATFNSLASPTLEEKQWLEFPGGRTLAFAGRTWRVKGPGYFGPGPNVFSDGAGQVWVDASGRLHLTIQRIGGAWYSTEVALEDALGYGDYVFTTRGDLDALDPRAVLGLFIWEYGPCYDAGYLWWNPHNEVDVEYSRWGVPGNAVAQFVAQPYDWSGNLNRFDAAFGAGEVTSHAFRWLPDRVEFRSWRGGPGDERPATTIHAWTYTGAHVPRPEAPRAHLNLWQFNGTPATNQEVVFDAFTFVPACASPPCGFLGVEPPAGAPGLDMSSRPNPFVSRTAIHFVASRSGHVQVAVHDVLGRRVRTLFDGFAGPGAHELAWDGRDDSGRRVAAGVYLCRVQAEDTVRTARVILVR